MRKLVFHKADIKENLKVIKRCAEKALIYGVLTADAGGAGVIELAHILQEEGISHFAVREVQEVAALREAGFLEEEILVLRATRERDELEKLIDLGAVCTISSVDTGLALNAVAESRATVAEAHIQVDTGMGFGGFLVGEPEKILLSYRSLSNIAISGVYTQILSSPKKKMMKEQLKLFQGVIDEIHKAGFETGTVHAAGSFAFLRYEATRLGAVRCGSALLGRCQTKGHSLRPVGYGECEIAECRWLPRGHSIGIANPLVLKRPTRVAIVSCGYYHGFGLVRPRPFGFFAGLSYACKNCPPKTVLIGNQRARILGEIGAEEIVIDVTNIKCKAGDFAAFEIDPMFARGFTHEFR